MVYWAWQALAPYYHPPAIYCRAPPLLLQVADATTMVVRNMSECGVWKGNLVKITTRPATPRAHNYTLGTEEKSPLAMR
eukprot:797764-Pleurochrysis_carterae.AAC.1